MTNLYFSEPNGRFEIHDGEYENIIGRMFDLENYLAELSGEIKATKKAMGIMRIYPAKALRDMYTRKRKLDTLVNEENALWLLLSGRKPEYEKSEWVQELKKKGMNKIKSEIAEAKKQISDKEKRVFVRIEKMFS